MKGGKKNFRKNSAKARVVSSPDLEKKKKKTLEKEKGWFAEFPVGKGAR